MKTIVYTEPDQCRLIWEKLWPAKELFDLWQVRSCFHEAFSRPLSFYVAEQDRKPVGCLPLCWNEEDGNYVQFPGETWQQKTWLEQNRLIARSPDALEALLDSVPGSLHLRYLTQSPLLDSVKLAHQDEVGYLFFPESFNFSFENYWLSFTGKSRKKIKAELKKLEDQNVQFRFNRKKDLDHLFRMNMEAFGKDSYFNDPRFHRSFENLVSFLDKMGIMRITTVLIRDTIAAVDLGAVWENSYTLLAGGTNPEFPGVAKLINLHHMEWSCRERLGMVDFLCGDFNWKKRFLLSPRPLYEINLNKRMPLYGRHIACA